MGWDTMKKRCIFPFFSEHVAWSYAARVSFRLRLTHSLVKGYPTSKTLGRDQLNHLQLLNLNDIFQWFMSKMARDQILAGNYQRSCVDQPKIWDSLSRKAKKCLVLSVTGECHLYKLRMPGCILAWLMIVSYYWVMMHLLFPI